MPTQVLLTVQQKAAVVAMTKNVAIQFAGKGIRCNAVCPGPTITPLLSSDEIATFDQEFMKTCNEHICRSVPKAEAVDQANAILYFASDLSKAVTGQAFGSRLRLQSVKKKTRHI